MDFFGDVVGGGVDFGDGDLGVVGGVGGVEGGELFVFGGEAAGSVSYGGFKGVGGINEGNKDLRFAVAAPWGVVFHEDIFVVVNDYFLVIVSNDDLDRAFLFLGNRLRLDAGLDLAVDKVLNERADFLLAELFSLIKRKLGVLGSVLNGEGGELVSFEVEIAGVGTVGFGVDGREADNAFVLLGKRF